jgi:hypothetical protein
MYILRKYISLATKLGNDGSCYSYVNYGMLSLVCVFSWCVQWALYL